ncbi:sulfotransferase [Pseudomonas fluorescens]|uniref:sulfotransferase n=1 Tax=Pseudomonas fluorescens TaxID=294 RepID=UPI001CA6EF20|nr:sulfotransferase [Pseudomonas fluorescens]MBY8937810.1 sulfotransferase [Pseudomonas fluorescens]
MHKPTAILVLGMPRSGTSAVTRVLNLRGAALSGNLLPAAKPNPKGFFESADALAIHERLLTALGRTWFDVSEMPERWLEHPATQTAYEELIALVRREYSDQMLWIIKEPRMCRIVPLWLRVLESLDIAPRALLVTRHPDEVVSSVARMVGEEQWGPKHTEVLWLEYFFEAEKATREIPRAMITYDQLLEDWAGSVERVEAELKLEWPVPIAEAKHEIDAYLGVENRHHDHNSSADPQRKQRTFAERVYSVCNEMQSDYWRVIENAQAEFSEMLALFSSPMHEAVNRAVEQRDQETLVQQAELEALRQHHNDVFFTQHAELIALKEARCEMEEAIIKMEKALSESNVEISKLINSLNEVSYELGVVATREESCQQQLREVQASYAALHALTGSRMWLAKKIFSMSKK